VTDWWGDSAAWATAVGTISATVTALYIASRGWREAAAEREDRDAAQARRVTVDDNQEGSYKITNFSDAPILNVGVRSAIRVKYGWLPDNPPEFIETRLRGASSGERRVLGPGETLTIDALSENHSGIKLTIRFTDANGLDWKRTSSGRPVRSVERRRRARRGVLSLIRKKRFERRYPGLG
jgi:hypothetical protein